MIQYGICGGTSVYSILWVSLPITYNQFYYPWANIRWTAQNNTWFTVNTPAGGAPVTDICGSVGYEDKTMGGFYIQSFSTHYWITIGY